MSNRPDVSPGAPLSRRIRRWGVATAFWTLLLVTLFLVFGPGLPGEDPAEPSKPPAAGAERAPASTPAPTDRNRDRDPARLNGPAMPRSAPTRLKIGKIGVDAPFTGLSIGPSGALDAPPADDTNLVGWQTSGITPGERGTALIAGHLDTATSPAVFARLTELAPKDRFEVKRADGTTAVFVVDSVESFRKDDFPDERVYADTPAALVRLITCAGAYDRTAKDYTENLVVFAHLERQA
ncbi:class F sortase [Streptomyces sp. NPDC048604]|uniref:class F sortase n=1 Tax=Streptomyces sp. NPDC048604 TaxID=3365578 RepID=UPI00370F810E